MPPTWPHGLECEIFSYEWLDRAAKEAIKPSEREHVSPFIRNHRGVKKVNLDGPGPQTVRHRWTLDHPEIDRSYCIGWSWAAPSAPKTP